MAKCFIPGPTTSKEIGTSQLCYNPTETGETRFDGKINTAGDRSKQCRHFSTRKMTTFLKQNSGFYLLFWCPEHLHSILQFFYPLSGTDGDEVPNCQWFSKRFRHLPQDCSRLISLCYSQLWQSKPGDSFHSTLCCQPGVCPHVNCSVSVLLVLATPLVK